MRKFIKSNRWLFPFLLLSLIMGAISYITSHFVISEEMVYESLSNRVSSERIEDIMANQSKYQWLNYVLNPILLLISFLIISAVVAVGVHLKSYKISFKKILTVVTYSSFIFLLPKLIKLVYFLFYAEEFTIDEYRAFSPHSLIFYIDKSLISKWLYYPVYLVNISEFVFWFILAYGIKLISNLSFVKSFMLIIQTYVAALLFWAVVVVFIFVSLS